MESADRVKFIYLELGCGGQDEEDESDEMR